MELSVVVVAYNIPRELPRTLLTLSTGYQRDVSEHDYEVIVVDNGSAPAVDEAVFADLDGRFRLVRIDDAPPSPYHAANVGLRAAEGDMVAVLIDGARMVSPGFIRSALRQSHAPASGDRDARLVPRLRLPADRAALRVDEGRRRRVAREHRLAARWVSTVRNRHDGRIVGQRLVRADLREQRLVSPEGDLADAGRIRRKV